MKNSLVREATLPPLALLAKYNPKSNSNLSVGYTDCFVSTVNGEIPFEDFVFAFYTSRVFRLERWLLSVVLRTRANDENAKQLASGKVEEYSYWTVESRGTNQLLMCDKSGRTRSWLMSTVTVEGSNTATQLHFGSAVRAVKNRRGELTLGFLFHSLTAFHKLYSRLLLKSAVKGLQRKTSGA